MHHLIMHSDSEVGEPALCIMRISTVLSKVRTSATQMHTMQVQKFIPLWGSVRRSVRSDTKFIVKSKSILAQTNKEFK